MATGDDLAARLRPSRRCARSRSPSRCAPRGRWPAARSSAGRSPGKRAAPSSSRAPPSASAGATRSGWAQFTMKSSGAPDVAASTAAMASARLRPRDMGRLLAADDRVLADIGLTRDAVGVAVATGRLPEPFGASRRQPQRDIGVRLDMVRDGDHALDPAHERTERLRAGLPRHLAVEADDARGHPRLHVAIGPDRCEDRGDPRLNDAVFHRGRHRDRPARRAFLRRHLRGGKARRHQGERGAGDPPLQQGHLSLRAESSVLTEARLV